MARLDSRSIIVTHDQWDADRISPLDNLMPGTGTERVGLYSDGEGCSIFYLELTGEAVLIKEK